MTRRTIIVAVLATGMAALFARLGVWQLQRLAERRAFNTQFERRLSAEPVSLDQLPTDIALAQYRRVRVTGRYDFDHEIIITARSRQGAPGVYLVTPLIPDGGGRAVLVNRGYVYSPDASTIDRTRWHEPEHATVEGYVHIIPSHLARDPRSVANPMAWRALDRERLARALPYPVEPYTIIQLAHGERPPGAPTRLELPAMDEGPHKSYAIQWFSFAAIALYGVVYLLWTESRKPRVGGAQSGSVWGEGRGFR